MEREKIIKALEFCANNDDCVGVMCPYYTIGCEYKMPKDALSLIKEQEQKIFELEKCLKERENGYEGTLYLDRCKLHDAEEKVKELTQANEQLSESYDHLEKTKDELLAERSRLTEHNAQILQFGEEWEALARKFEAENKKLTEENERLRAELAERPPKLVITKLPKKGE